MAPTNAIKRAKLKLTETLESTGNQNLKDRAVDLANRTWMQGKETAARSAAEAAALAKQSWAAGVVAASDISQFVAKTDWARSLNEVSSEVTRAMDREFLKGGPGSVDLNSGNIFSPSNHRILDGGHGVADSIGRAIEVGEREGYSAATTFWEWAKAYSSDLSSQSGMPIPFAESIYSILKQVGCDEKAIQDLVTVNGQEALESLLAGTIASAALIFAWRNEDKKAFSQTLGALGITAITGLNPATFVVMVMGLAIGYQRQVVAKEDMKRGALVSAVGLGVSFLIPGPILLGAIPAFVLTTYLQKKLKSDIPVEQQVKAFAEYLTSAEFRALASNQLSGASDWINSRLDKTQNKTT